MQQQRNEIWTSLGAIYDPATDSWTSVSPPSGAGWVNTDACGTANANGGIGDAESIVLPNGTFLLAACCAYPAVNALFNPSNLTWSATGAFPGYQDEQGYTLLQNGNVLTIDVWDPPAAHVYNFGTGTWSAINSLPVSLVDPTTCGNYEIGPAVTRPDGTVVAFGGNTGCTTSPADPTAIYNPGTGVWIQGPNVPAVCASGTTSCDLADAPAALLPNGNILFAASDGYGNSPTHFFEFTTSNTIIQVADPLYFASTSGAFYYNFLVLPNGQIFVTDFSNTPELYTPVGSANAAWQPTISAFAGNVYPGNAFTVSGTQLNGLSQGAAYGDDVQGATNYPIVQITNNASGHVFYSTSFGYSTMSIAQGQSGSTNYALPQQVEQGPSKISIIANGVASAPVSLNVQRNLYTKAPDFNGDGSTDSFGGPTPAVRR